MAEKTERPVRARRAKEKGLHILRKTKLSL